MLKCMSRFPSCGRQEVTLHCMDEPEAAPPFPCGWTHRLAPPFGRSEYCSQELGAKHVTANRTLNGFSFSSESMKIILGLTSYLGP